MADGDQATFQLTLSPMSESFASDDTRWQSQAALFARELEAEVGGVTRRTTPVEGTKGGVEDIVLALGTAGAFSAAVAFFKAWLDRDQDRSITMAWRNGDEASQEIVLRATAVDDGVFQMLAEAAAARLGGNAWARVRTKPS